MDFFEIYICYINKIQNEFKYKDSASIWPEVTAPDRPNWISLKFIWHMTSNKTQAEFKKGGTCQFGASANSVGSKLYYSQILQRVPSNPCLLPFVVI